MSNAVLETIPLVGKDVFNTEHSGKKVSHRIIPFGDRILVKRRLVGNTIGKAGVIIAPDQVAEHKTDIADVVYIPDMTSADKMMIVNSEEMFKAFHEKVKAGDSLAFESMLKLRNIIKTRIIKPGDVIIIGKYVGIDFQTSDSQQILTLVREEDIIGVVMKVEE